MSRDHATALQPGQQSKIPSKKKKEKLDFIYRFEGSCINHSLWHHLEPEPHFPAWSACSHSSCLLICFLRTPQSFSGTRGESQGREAAETGPEGDDSHVDSVINVYLEAADSKIDTL